MVATQPTVVFASFPLLSTDSEFNNCTASMNRQQPWCITSVVTGAWGYCQHVLQISLVAGQFGRASFLLDAQDSYGGHLQTSVNVVVQMVNDAPFFQLPAVLTTFQNFGFGFPEWHPAFVSILSLGVPRCQELAMHNIHFCCVEQNSDNASFHAACPPATRSEDNCQRSPCKDHWRLLGA